MKAKAEINPGICGLMTSLEATSDEMQVITLKGTSQCPAITKIIADLQSEELDAFECCLGKMDESPVYVKSFGKVTHAACPVPSAIIKLMEVAASLALPKDVEIKLSKED